ncbi:hypothetical protein [Nocardioides ultimimeridianus]
MHHAGDLIWHYTTSVGLKGILVDHTLRATSVSFVNDPTEQRFGMDAVTTALERLKKSEESGVAAAARAMSSYRDVGLISLSDRFGFSERMVACASRASDSLDMWRAYGAQDVSGTFAVGLDPSAPLGPLFTDPLVLEQWTAHWGAGATAPDMRGGWRSMNYVSPAELAAHAFDVLSEGVQQLPTNDAPSDRELDCWHLVDRVVAEIEANYKHHAYAAEQEVRLQASLTSPRQFQVMPRPHGISAYIELTASDSWGLPVSAASRLPVREVVLWPGAPRQALSGVAAALVRGGHNYSSRPLVVDQEEPGVRITQSQVPFV